MLPDASRVGNEIGETIADRITSHVDDIQVRVDAGRSVAQLRRIDQALERIDGRRVHVELDIDALGALAEVRALGILLDRLDGRTVGIDVDVDRPAAGLSALSGAATSAAGGLQRLGGAAGLVRMAPLAGGVLVVVSVVQQFVAAVGPAVGIIAALPAVAAGAVAAFGVLKLATTGVGEAFGAALTADTEKFQESLKGLSPAARSVAVELRALRPQLMGLRNAAQQALFAPLRGELTRMAGVLGGPLRAGVRGVAGEFGRMAASVTRFARSAETVKGVRVGFAAVRESLAVLRPALEPFLAGLRAVAIEGTPALTRIATVVAGLATRFGEWLSKLAESGRIGSILDSAFSSLSLIAGVAGDLFGIFSGLFKSMVSAGGGLVGVLAQGADQLNRFLSSAEGQNALTAFFQAINAGWQIITPVIGVIGELVGQLVRGLLPVLTPLIGLVRQMATEVGATLSEALRQAIPSLVQMVVEIAKLLPLLTPILPIFARWVATIAPLIPAVASLAATLVGYLVPVLRFVITNLVRFWQTVANLVLPVFARMVSVVQWVASIITPVFHGIWVGIQTLGRWAMWLWTNAIQPAFRFIANLGKWLYSIIAVAVIGPILVQFKIWSTVAQWLWKSVIRPVFSGIGGFIRDTWRNVIQPALSAIWGFLRNTLGPVFTWIYRNVIRPVWNAVGSAIGFVWRNAIRPVFNAVRDGVGKLAGYFSTAVKAIGKAWDGLKSAAKKPVAFVVNTVYNGGIVRIWNAVADLVPGVSKLGEVKGFARGGVMPGYAPGRDKLLAAVSPGESIFRPEFTRAVGQDFVTGANAAARSGGVSGVLRYLHIAGDPGMGPGFAGHFAFGGIVGGFLKAAKNWFAGGLVNTATKAFNPLIDGAQRAIGRTAFGDMAVGAARGLVGKILGFFGPLERELGGNAVVRAARTQLGVPYVWGGTSWDVGLDCSGLTSQAWKRGAGVWIGRTTYAQYPDSRPIDGPRPAALGFPHLGHVVMASKPGYIIEAPYTGANVREVPISRGYQWRWPNAASGLKFDQGGWLPTGVSMVYNGTGAPEPVLTDAQWARVSDAAAGGDGGTHFHAHLDEMTKAAYESQIRTAFTAMQVAQAQRDRTGRRR
ncbi:NlpC/P60 family protein [Actinomadura sp. CNU-125]|uniref:NlpC/P60 family protein n=1 Tax=Actinomadura sp. CNU-125 TaxID=1904961 RepID=UPI0011776FD3|nr:NlpC/P60 family protein [Actinomadura sp. CNU-125]